MQQTFFDILREENNKGVTILFSSHILSEVQKMCNRIAILKEGKVISLQNIHELRADAYKKVHLSVESNISDSSLSLDGITKYEKNGGEISFIYKGSVNRLIDAIQPLKATDILIEEPSLEEIFMHYYQ